MFGNMFARITELEDTLQHVQQAAASEAVEEAKRALRQVGLHPCMHLAGGLGGFGGPGSPSVRSPLPTICCCRVLTDEPPSMAPAR